MEVRSEKRIRYIIILLTLLIHIFIISLLFLRIMHNHSSIILPYQETPPTDWAARQAPVVFTELSEAEQPQPKPEKQEAPQKTAQHSAQATPHPEPIQETHKAPAQEEVQPSSEIEPEQTQAESPLPIFMPKDHKPHVTRAQKQVKASSSGAPLKLADITRMYMHQVGDVPLGDFFMAGNPHNLPPDKQIIFERYRNKLSALIAQVYKSRPFHFQIPMGTSIKFYLSLGRSGRFNEVSIIESSGYPAIDQFCVSIYKQASEQFPPIPETLEESMPMV